MFIWLAISDAVMSGLLATSFSACSERVPPRRLRRLRPVPEGVEPDPLR